MQPQGTAKGSTAATSPSRIGWGTALGAIAIVIALIGVAMNLVIPGPTGAQGVPGPASNTYWAVVDQSGNLLHGNAATSATMILTGVYQVTFAEDVSNCAYLATVGVGAMAIPGSDMVSVAAVSGNPHAVQVSITNLTTQMLAKSRFSVAAVCGAGLWAVVSSTGTLVRGSGVLSATMTGPGVFDVKFDQVVENCSFLASLGSTGSGSAPVGVVTVADFTGTSDGIKVATWADTGESISFSFHLVAICSSPTWAVVRASGAEYIGSSNGTSLAGTGLYLVNFTNYMANCAAIGTVGSSDLTTPAPGMVATAEGFIAEYSFWAYTFDMTGASASEPFNLAAFC
jgi:hypothetical protein